MFEKLIKAFGLRKKAKADTLATKEVDTGDFNRPELPLMSLEDMLVEPNTIVFAYNIEPKYRLDGVIYYDMSKDEEEGRRIGPPDIMEEFFQKREMPYLYKILTYKERLNYGDPFFHDVRLGAEVFMLRDFARPWVKELREAQPKWFQKIESRVSENLKRNSGDRVITSLDDDFFIENNLVKFLGTSIAEYSYYGDGKGLIRLQLQYFGW